GLVCAGEAVGAGPSEAAVDGALEHHAGDVAGEGSACGLCAWEVIVHVHFSGGGAGASVAAGDHQSVGACFAHRRGLVRAGEAVRPAPREAAVAAALGQAAGSTPGERSARTLWAGEISVHATCGGGGARASRAG